MLLNLKKISRLNAVLFHFSISLAVFFLMFVILISIWYPGIYFGSSGGLQGIKIVAGVDVVLGPLLMSIVFNPRKTLPELKTDISVIVIGQVIALLWGVYALFDQRPVAVVFWENSFMTVPAYALKEQAYSLENLNILSNDKPPMVYAKKPKKLEDLKNMMDVILKQHIPPHHQPGLYRPLKDHFFEIKPQQVNIDEVLVKSPEVKNQLLPVLQKNKKNTNDVFYFLLQSKYRNGLLIFDTDARYLGGVMLD
jgi:hypothetical protein